MAKLIWTNTPEQTAVERNYKFIKALPGKTLRCRILSGDVAVTRVHFWRKRSFGHLEKDCPACIAGNQYRWTGFLFVALPSERTMRILQVTGFVASQLHAERSRRTTLKNLEIELSRKDERPNGELFLKVKGQIEGCEYNPTTPLLPPILERTWEQENMKIESALDPVPLRLAPTGTDGKIVPLPNQTTFTEPDHLD